MDWLITLLNFFGITPDKYPFLVLAVLILGSAAYVRISIGTKLNRVKDNVLIIITHLSTASRGKLDTTLIRAMSPITITEEGKRVLEESGFTAIMQNEPHRSDICSQIHGMNPATKLDVENFSIVAFAKILEQPYMVPVKAWLYNHPSQREHYNTLAGVFIRDHYLQAHPEITQ